MFRMSQRTGANVGIHRRILPSLVTILSVCAISVLVAAGCGGTTGGESNNATATTPTLQPTMSDDNFSTPVDSETPAASEGEQALNVEAMGFAKKGESVGYGAVIVNPSSQDALEVEITVNLLDAKGNVFETDTGTLTGIPAGSKFYYGGEVYVQKSDKPKRLEVYADAGSWDSIDLVLPKISNVQVINEEYWGTKVRGQVTNNLDKTLSSLAKIGVVLFDKRGRVVGGGYTYLDADLKSGRKASFESVNGPAETPFSRVHQAAVSMENSVN